MRLCCLLLGMLVACGDSGSNASGTDPTVFIWGKSGDAVKLDPAVVTDGESVMVCTNIFDTLVAFDRPYRAQKLERAAISAPGVVDADTWLQTPARRVRPDGSESGTVRCF